MNFSFGRLNRLPAHRDSVIHTKLMETGDCVTDKDSIQALICIVVGSFFLALNLNKSEKRLEFLIAFNTHFYGRNLIIWSNFKSKAYSL